MVVSQNFSSATSLAMLAPISTLIVMPSFSWITSEMSLSPSGPSSTPWRSDSKEASDSKITLRNNTAFSCSLTAWTQHGQSRDYNNTNKEQSQTLMSDIPSASLLTLPFTVSHTLPINWCGITKTKMSASLDASTRSGTATWEKCEAHNVRKKMHIKKPDAALWMKFLCTIHEKVNPAGLTTLAGSLCPGRYFTFSWVVLIISVSFFPFTISSNTHILTVLSNFGFWATLAPTILAMAEPLGCKQLHVGV